ncbi:MAG TPA: phosphoglycerate mutase family protein [Mycobacteriales bacterium]|nr:phosphoglycerate mutase family protein [Mycobacteriales bacterium]
MSSRMWLVRHGQSAANAGEATSDPATIPLTDVGHEQARKLARDIGWVPDLVVTSPFTRARQTARPLLDRCPQVATEVWPIHEFTYLASQRCANTTWQQRRPLVAAYWDREDLDFVDGPGAESFAQLAQRAKAFHRRLAEQKGSIVAFGHETFFRTYLLGLGNGFAYTAADMRQIGYGTTPPGIANGEILPLSHFSTDRTQVSPLKRES